MTNCGGMASVYMCGIIHSKKRNRLLEILFDNATETISYDSTLFVHVVVFVYSLRLWPENSHSSDGLTRMWLMWSPHLIQTTNDKAYVYYLLFLPHCWLYVNMSTLESKVFTILLYITAIQVNCRWRKTKILSSGWVRFTTYEANLRCCFIFCFWWSFERRIFFIFCEKFLVLVFVNIMIELSNILLVKKMSHSIFLDATVSAWS